MVMAGWPLRRLSVSWVAAPSSTRATSRMRRTEPSGLARTTMLANSSGVARRPLACRFIWMALPSIVGLAPMRPTAPWTFCVCRAATMSDGARPRSIRRAVWNQMRIE